MAAKGRPMDKGYAALARQYGVSPNYVKKCVLKGIPLGTPPMTLAERARVANDARRAKFARKEEQRVERDAAWVDTIRAGSPHPWHKLLARMAA